MWDISLNGYTMETKPAPNSPYLKKKEQKETPKKTCDTKTKEKKKV